MSNSAAVFLIVVTVQSVLVLAAIAALCWLLVARLRPRTSHSGRVTEEPAQSRARRSELSGRSSNMPDPDTLRRAGDAFLAGKYDD